jgi:hypothetical protein
MIIVTKKGFEMQDVIRSTRLNLNWLNEHLRLPAAVGTRVISRAKNGLIRTAIIRRDNPVVIFTAKRTSEFLGDKND